MIVSVISPRSGRWGAAFARCATSRTCFLLFATLLLIALSVSRAADRNNRSPEAAKTAKARLELIRTEIAQLGPHAWAGEYYAGDGLGMNISLSVAPSAGYVFEWHGCLGLYDRNYGTVTAAEDGQLQLSFAFENIRKGFRGLAPRLVPVRWGERRYLIPADNVVGFCNEVNQGAEPRRGMHGRFLLCRGDEKKKVIGSPAPSTEFQPFLLPQPVQAHIVAVGRSTTRPSVAEWKFKDTPVTLDAGSSKGLRVGMELLVTKPDMVESVTLTKVEEDRSEGIVTQIGEEEPKPKAGWQLSTQARWRVPAEE